MRLLTKLSLLVFFSISLLALIWTYTQDLGPKQSTTVHYRCQGPACGLSGGLNILENPWYERAAKIHLPGGTHFIAQSYKPLAIIKHLNAQFIVTKDRQILSAPETQTQANLPWILLCDSCSWENPSIQETTLGLLEHLNEPSAGVISELSWENSSRLSLLVNRKGLGNNFPQKIYIPRAHLELDRFDQRILSINQILQSKGVIATRLDLAPGKKVVVKTRTDS